MRRFIVHCALCLPLMSFACDAHRDNADIGISAASRVSCDAITHIDSLPSLLREASGVASSRTHPGILWVHNDGENPYVMFALDTLGRIRGRIRIAPPFAGSMDWEDIAVAPCGGHDCIYLADIGDNYTGRKAVRILKFEEPDPAVDSVASPVAYPFRYPDGRHDAEAMFILPGERVFVITKGRNAPVALFRYPGMLRADTVTLELVRNMTPGIVQFPDMVTAASASPDGRRVAVRTYSFLRFYEPAPDGQLLLLQPDSFPLAATHEFQGEGVSLDDHGRVFLVGEKGFDTLPPPLSRLDCH